MPDKLTERLEIRLSSEEKAQIEAAAKADRTTVSHYIRAKVIGVKDNPYLPEDYAAPQPKPEKVVEPPPHSQAALERRIKQLQNQGLTTRLARQLATAELRKEAA